MNHPSNRIGVVFALVLLQATPAFSQLARKGGNQTVGSGLRIEVTNRESGQPVAEADVLVRDVPERGVPGKKIEMKVKAEPNGIAQLSGIPAGKIFVQVSAKGFKSFSRWYEHAGGGQTIQIQLERPPRWEGKTK